MTDCPLSSEERVQQLLSSPVDPQSAKAILDHLGEPCDACLEALKDVDTHLLLQRLAGPLSVLSTGEASRMLAEVMPASSPVGVVRERKKPALPLFSRRSVIRGVAACAAVVVPVLLYAVIQAQHTTMGIKGASSATQPLTVRLGVFSGKLGKIGTETVRRFGSGDDLQRDDALLFRCSLSAPGYLYLANVGTKEILWRSNLAGLKSPPLPAGETEVVENGRALAFPASEVQARTRIVLLGSPKPLSDETVHAILGADLTREALTRTCSGCSIDSVSVNPPQPQ